MQECKVLGQGLAQNICELKAATVIIDRTEMTQENREKLVGYQNNVKGWGGGDKNQN